LPRPRPVHSVAAIKEDERRIIQVPGRISEHMNLNIAEWTVAAVMPDSTCTTTADASLEYMAILCASAAMDPRSGGGFLAGCIGRDAANSARLQSAAGDSSAEAVFSAITSEFLFFV